MAGTASWDDPATVEAVKDFFVDLNAKGYLIPTPTAVNYDDSGNLFKGGDAGMMITGTWLISDITSNAKFKLVIETWRRLPLGVANWLGPYVVRNLG